MDQKNQWDTFVKVMNTPKKWHEVYPQGTKQGEDEAKLFRALSRHPKYDFRSTGAIEQETGLSKERIEEIIDKYASQYHPPLIYPHPKNEDHWGYWERCVDKIKTSSTSISKKDKDSRIGKHLKAKC